MTEKTEFECCPHLAMALNNFMWGNWPVTPHLSNLRGKRRKGNQDCFLVTKTLRGHCWVDKAYVYMCIK
jgi:hypothetical protein